MATEMKVTNKRGVGFYFRAASSFFMGVEAKEAADGKEAVEAKPPVDALTISGLGEAIDVATAVAAKIEAESIARISQIETGYPAMTNGRGCAQITIKMTRVEAPNLHKFLWSAANRHQALIKKIQGDSELMFNQEACEALAKKDNAEFMETVGNDLLLKSFKVHDKDGNGVLDEDESALFFSHVTAEISELLRSQVKKQMSIGMSQLLPNILMGACHPNVRATGDKLIKQLVKDLCDAAAAEFAAIVNEEYYTKKDERNAAALKVLDKNGDGKLQLKEFLRAFEAGTGSDELAEALGISLDKHRERVNSKVKSVMELGQAEFFKKIGEANAAAHQEFYKKKE